MNSINMFVNLKSNHITEGAISETKPKHVIKGAIPETENKRDSLICESIPSEAPTLKKNSTEAKEAINLTFQ